MVKPSVVVDAFSELNEDVEILRAKVELALRSLEIKAAIRGQLAACVLAFVYDMERPRSGPDAGAISEVHHLVGP